MSKVNGKTAEHMSKGELVGEFRRLQNWYRLMKIEVDKLESEHVQLQTNFANANELISQQQLKLDTKDKMILDEITKSNQIKQVYFQRVQELTNKIRKMENKEKNVSWLQKLKRRFLKNGNNN